MLGEDGEEAHGKGIGVGYVAADEVHPGVAEGQDETGIATEPVEFGDKQYPTRGAGRDYSRE